jgi:uncharacterized protein YhfF
VDAAADDCWKLPPLDEVLAMAAARGITLPPGNIRVGAFGDSAALSEQLLALIRAGRKRGGASLVWSHGSRTRPCCRGDIEIVRDHCNRLALITRNVQVDVKPFSAVGADFAAVEGEADGSLEYWQREHWRYFTRECRRIGRLPEQSMPVVCERFELLHDLATMPQPI